MFFLRFVLDSIFTRMNFNNVDFEPYRNIFRPDLIHLPKNPPGGLTLALKSFFNKIVFENIWKTFNFQTNFNYFHDDVLGPNEAWVLRDFSKPSNINTSCQRYVNIL